MADIWYDAENTIYLKTKTPKELLQYILEKDIQDITKIYFLISTSEDKEWNDIWQVTQKIG